MYLRDDHVRISISFGGRANKVVAEYTENQLEPQIWQISLRKKIYCITYLILGRLPASKLPRKLVADKCLFCPFLTFVWTTISHYICLCIP